MNLTFTGTFSKSPLAWGFEEELCVEEAHGVRVRLSDGKEYIDWVSGLGSNLLGYGVYNNAYAKAIINQLGKGGGSLSLPSLLEQQVAEKLAHLLEVNTPGWQGQKLGVRFAKTGSDTTTMAVRLARAITGKSGILCVKGGYHGWGDWTVARTEPAYGVTDTEGLYTEDFDFNNVASLYRAADILKDFGIAAVIIEQGLEKPADHFYEEVRAFCDNQKCLLIMDEIVTGLRYGLGGACGLYGIEPDLVCMGKALGNGLPVSALIGRKEYMDRFARVDPVFCSSTFWGESLGIAAADVVLNEWGEKQIQYIWELGEKLQAGLDEAGWTVIGDPPRSLLTFKRPEHQAFFIHSMREQGFLMNRPNFPTLAHTREDVDLTIEAVRVAKENLDAMIERGVLGEWAKGKLPRVLFSNR